MFEVGSFEKNTVQFERRCMHYSFVSGVFSFSEDARLASPLFCEIRKIELSSISLKRNLG
jgi:hypothetical protein